MVVSAAFPRQNALEDDPGSTQTLRAARPGGAVTGFLRRRGLWPRDGDDQDDDDNNSFGDGPSRGGGAGD